MTNQTTWRRFLLLLLLALIAALLLRAELALDAAAAGLRLWWQAVVPALLPFFVISQLLLLSGAAAELGRMLSPLMRPLFNLPGEAALAVLMGFCAGFPTGAAITAGLYREGLITAEEGGRLVAYTNNAGPLFITAFICVGLLGCAEAAALLAAVHYGLNLLLGIWLGQRSKRRGTAVVRSLAAAPPTQLDLGMIKAAAQQAISNLLLIGCYMVFFSVLAGLVTAGAASGPVHALVSSLVEMSLGVNSIVELGLPLTASLPLISAALGWGGLSVQMQVLAMISGTPISPRRYLLARPLHALASAVLTALLAPRLQISAPTASLLWPLGWDSLPLYGGLAGAALLLFILLAGLFCFFQRVVLKRF